MPALSTRSQSPRSTRKQSPRERQPDSRPRPLPGCRLQPFVVDRAGAEPADTLICFPFAGGGASAFRPWARLSEAAGISLVAVQYPGRETLRDQPMAISLAALADDIAAAIAAHRASSLILFGHSFGAMVALETARRLTARGDPRLARLVVSGARAPGAPHPEQLHTLPDAAFLAQVKAFGGMPAAVAESAELLALALPVLRGDFRLMETHAPPEAAPLPLALTVLGGRSDAHVPLATLFGWQAVTSRSMRLGLFDGGHFFPFEAAGDVLAAIARDLEATRVAA